MHTRISKITPAAQAIPGFPVAESKGINVVNQCIGRVYGPPCVITLTESKILKDAMDATTEVNRMVGEIIGRVILKNTLHFGVESSSAAS